MRPHGRIPMTASRVSLSHILTTASINFSSLALHAHMYNTFQDGGINSMPHTLIQA